ncbi:beta-N-acetylhexosaminidase [Streptomyces sp. NBC_01220]|uniref:beta-N-acetylhexosaminidase n=1 Tax=unclassified Streptomyces TaxID=2593676 RepID=UPI002E29F1B7|nr:MULTISPECIES: beta-N-acetylhexosaminidase [unclassified Streptomyces]WSQ42825.1 beta-N-acetylhexosaminidase [Streptomyces sp. NBC_01220]
MPASRPEHSLLPRPRKVSSRPGRFTLDQDTSVRAYPGAEGAADLLRTLLAPATGLPLPPSATGRVVLALDPQLGGLGEEGYGLTIGPDSLLLRAARLPGLLCGVQTIRQLLPAEALSGTAQRDAPWMLPCVEISDVPAHPWRGSMLDVARHFQPVSYLRRYVDLMALHKLNTLHLHLTDDQGWRMPVPAYPRLTGIGGHRRQSMSGPPGRGDESFDGIPHSGAYTRQELRDLVRYAAARGVRVVPEIEMPGHVRAALAAHPELGNNPGRRLDVWTRWGVCDTVFGVHEEVFDFCRTVLEEVMDVFPSPYIHIGGEECPTTEWESSPAARARAAAEGLPDARALHGWFMGRIGSFLTEQGRRPVGWAETGTELPPEFTVMTWRDPAHALAAARRGHQVVAAHYRATYLDYAQSADPGEPPAQPGPPVGLRAVHGNRPVPDGWDAADAARVLGTQAQLWTEYAGTPERIEYLTYPRLCALADRAWSGGRSDWPGFVSRLGRHTARLDALGVGYRPLNPRSLQTTSPGAAPPR